MKQKPNGRPTLAPRKKSQTKRAISITIDPQVLAQVDTRADVRSEQIVLDLTRYYRLLAEARPALRERLAPNEISLIIDCCNGWAIIRPDDPLYLWHNVEDAIRLDRLDAKWEIADGADLVQRLRALAPVESLALADAVVRFWHAVGEGDHTREPARALD